MSAVVRLAQGRCVALSPQRVADLDAREAAIAAVRAQRAPMIYARIATKWVEAGGMN